MSELSGIIAHLDGLLRLGTAPARAASRDTPGPAPLDPDGNLDRTSQVIKRPGTGGGAFYRPNAAALAGRDPATSRPAYGSVKPSGGRRTGKSAEQTRADSENDARRAWVTTRENTARDAGDVLPTGAHYPRYITRNGNLGPSARY